jgi:hypothetical protein
LVSVSAALTVLYAPPSREVQFNCPWCTTRLALPETDFATEKAVLCPRCNNPVDLTVQRRLQAQPASPAMAPPRRQVTVPTPPPPPQQRRPQPQPAPAPGRTLPPLERKRSGTGSLDFDPGKPIDIEGAFKGEPIHVDDIDSLMSNSDLWKWDAPRAGPRGGPSSPKDGVVECPSCKYENAPVVPGFEFGKVRKCTWCGKPLPE